MATSYSPKVNTVGLVFYLDAANPKSYPRTGTIWNDLSGNRINGTLTLGPTFNGADGGSIVFDGADDYVICAGSITTSTGTFISWIKRNGTQAQFDGIVFSRSTNVTGINFYTSNQLGYHWNGAINTYEWPSGLTIPNSTWCMCAVSVAASSATAYICQSSGITSAVNSVSHTSTVIDDINIGRDEFSTRLFSGSVASAFIYNRALTSAEIGQIFNATRTRFGV